MSFRLTNPIFKAKVISYERLAHSPKDVWFKEYELFPDHYEIEEWKNHKQGCYNIRNIEIYDVLIDLTKQTQLIEFPERTCRGCGKQIDGDRHVTIVNGEYYCNYDCFCEHHKETNYEN